MENLDGIQAALALESKQKKQVHADNAKRDIFQLTTIAKPQRNNAKSGHNFVTQGLSDLHQYLDYLAKKTVIEKDQEEIFINTLKAAQNIIIDGFTIWTKPYEDEEQEWTPKDTDRFKDALNQYISIPKESYTSEDIKIIQNYIYGLNQKASQAVCNFVGDSYEFSKQALRRVGKILKPHDCSFLFSNKVTFLREIDILTYRAEGESRACVSGYGCYQLNPETNTLELVEDPDKHIGSDNIICRTFIEATVDLSNYARSYRPQFSFKVTIETPYLKYTGSLGETVHEIKWMETAQTGDLDTSVGKQIHGFQKDAIKAGGLIQKFNALNLRKEPQNKELALSYVIELLHLVIDVHLQLNRLAVSYSNNHEINKEYRQLFSMGRDLRFFAADPSALPISLEDAFMIVFFGLDEKDLEKLYKRINDDFILSIQGCAEFLTSNPDTFKHQCKDNRFRNSFDPTYLAHINHIILQAIGTIRYCLANMRRIKQITTGYPVVQVPEAYSDEYQEYLYKLLEDILVPNPLSLTANPAIVSEFLSHITRNHKSPSFDILKSLDLSWGGFVKNNDTTKLVYKPIVNFLASGLNIGILLEKLLALGSESPDINTLELIVNLATEIKISSTERKELLSTGIEALDLKRPAAEEMLSVLNFLTDVQIFPLLKLFHPKIRSSNFFEEIEEAAKAIDSTEDTEQDKLNQFVSFLARVVMTTNTALEEIMQHRKLELISFKKQNPDEKSRRSGQGALQTLNEFISRITIENEEELQSVVAFFKGDIDLDRKDSPSVWPKAKIKRQDPPETTYEIVAAEIPKISRRRECFKDIQWNERLALLDCNGVVLAGKALAVNLFCEQFLKLDTVRDLTTKGWSMGLVMAGGIVGAGIGYRKIIHPNKPMNTFERMWGAVNNGLILGEFSLGTVINIYLYLNPNVVDISDPKFFEILFPGPFVLFTGYSVWNSLSPTFKEKWFPLNSKKHLFIENGIDLSFKMLYFSGVFSITSLVLLKVPAGDLMKGVVYPMVLALPLTMLDKTRIKDTANVTMNYLIAINFFAILGYQLSEAFLPNISNRTSSEESSNNNEQTIKILDSIQIAYWSLLLVFGLATMARHFISFPKRYNGDPNFLIRKRLANQTPLPEYSEDYHTDDEESHHSIGKMQSGDYKKLRKLTQGDRQGDLEQQPLLDEIAEAEAGRGGKVLMFSGKHKTTAKVPESQSKYRCNVM